MDDSQESDKSFTDHSEKHDNYESEDEKDVSFALEVNILEEKEEVKIKDEPVSVKTESELEPGSDIYKNITDEQRKNALKHKECFICKKRFGSFSSFKKHMIRCMRQGEKNYGCDMCGQDFAEKKYLQAHMTIHSGTSSYSCKICEKKLTSRSGLHGHMLTHSDEKKYKCKLCEKAFVFSSSRSKHMLSHNPDPSRKCGSREPHTESSRRGSGNKDKLDCRYLCDICSKEFSTLWNLTAHMRRHTAEKSYFCKECPKAFIDSKSLKKHMNIHLPEKPFHCDICPKKFNQKFYLKKHLERHEKGNLVIHYANDTNKVHQCIICFKQFGSSYTMRRHMASVHIDKPVIV